MGGEGAEKGVFELVYTRTRTGLFSAGGWGKARSPKFARAA